jgi:hypothetical protein
VLSLLRLRRVWGQPNPKINPQNPTHKENLIPEYNRMASSLTSPFHGLPIDEAIPAAADLTDLKQASILQGRRRIRFQPQTGQTADPGSIVQFVLSDSTGLLDVNSMVLSATPVVTGATAQPASTNVNLFDDGPSWCRRVQVIANGSLIEDIDNAHRATNLELLSCVGAEWYKHDGSWFNYWKFNETLSVANPTAQNNVVAHGVEVSNDLSGASFQCAWPLGLIAPSLRSNKYWPLRSMGELVLQFTMANASEALLAAAGNPSYQLKDIFLECDIVVPHPAYAALLDRMTQLESEPGLSIPIETRLVSQGQAIPSSTGALTESSIVTSRATTNLRRLVYAAQPTAGLNTYTYPSVSCFPDEGKSAWQVRVGSLYFPSQPANSLARMFDMTSAAFGEPASTDKSAVFNRHNYDTTTTGLLGAQAVFKQVPGVGGQFGGNLSGAAGTRFAYSDFSPVAYCFDSYKNTSMPLANDGVSILGQAGSQVITIVRMANPEAVTPTIVLDATKVIVLKDGGLRIMGA